MLGASGAIYGVLLAYGMSFPDNLILIFFVLPLKAKYAVVLFGLIEFLSLPGGGSVAHLAHLGGMLTGFLFLQFTAPALAPAAASPTSRSAGASSRPATACAWCGPRTAARGGNGKDGAPRTPEQTQHRRDPRQDLPGGPAEPDRRGAGDPAPGRTALSRDHGPEHRHRQLEHPRTAAGLPGLAAGGHGRPRGRDRGGGQRLGRRLGRDGGGRVPPRAADGRRRQPGLRPGQQPGPAPHPAAAACCC